MKSLAASLALAGTVLLLGSACYSINTPPPRAHHANPTFPTPAAKRAAREAEIRRLYPALSEKQIQQKLDGEFPSGVTR